MVWAEVPRTPDSPSTPADLGITDHLFETGFEKNEENNDQLLRENSNRLNSSHTDTSSPRNVIDNSEFQKNSSVNVNTSTVSKENAGLQLDNQEKLSLCTENENENYEVIQSDESGDTILPEGCINATYNEEIIFPDNQEFLDGVSLSECRGRSTYRNGKYSENCSNIDSTSSSSSTSRSSSTSSSDTLSSSSLYSSYSLLSTASSFTDNSSSFTEVTNLPITYLSPFPSASDLFALTTNIANMTKESESDELKLENQNKDCKTTEKSCIDEVQDEKTLLQENKKDNVINIEKCALKNTKSKSFDKTDVHIHKEKSRKNVINNAKIANNVEIGKYIVWESVRKRNSEKMCVDEKNIEKKNESNNKLKEIKQSTNLDMCSEIENKYNNKDIKSSVNKTLEKEVCTYNSNICTKSDFSKVKKKVIEADFEVKERVFECDLKDIHKDTLISAEEQCAIARCEKITRRIEELSEQIKERDREIKEIQEIELKANRPVKELIKEIELIEEGIGEIDLAKEVEKTKCENLMSDMNMDIPDSMKHKYLLGMQSFITRATDVEREQENMYREELAPLKELHRIKNRKLNRSPKPSPLTIPVSCNNSKAKTDSPKVQNDCTAISYQKEASIEDSYSSTVDNTQNKVKVTKDQVTSTLPCDLAENKVKNIEDKMSVNNVLENVNPVKHSILVDSKTQNESKCELNTSSASNLENHVDNSTTNDVNTQIKNKALDSKYEMPSSSKNIVEKEINTNYINKLHSSTNKKSNVPPVFLATWQLQGYKEERKAIPNINNSENINSCEETADVNAYRRRNDPSSAGMLTSCRIPQSIADTPEVIRSLKDFAAHDSYSVMDYNGCITTHNTRDTTNLREYSMRNSMTESLKGSLGKGSQTPDSPDSGRGSMFESFDLGLSESSRVSTPEEKEEKDNEDLGPKFFLELCRYWPDLIVRLAHDIALESPSPEDAPDPPDPPSGKSPCTCSDSSSHGSSNDKSKVSKCCSDEDPCCPQLPPDPSSCGGTTDLMAELAGLGGGGGGEALDHIMGTDSPICGSPAPRRPRPRPEGSSGPSSVGSEDHLEINMNLASEFGALSYLDDGDDADEDPGTPAEDEEGGASRPLKPRPSGEQRKRRKLPEIPKNKNSFSCASLLALRSGPNLADELAEVESGVASRSSTPDTLSLINSRPLLLLKCAANLRDDSCSPDSDLQLPLNDIDSGHSTQHSPDGAKSMSPQATVNGSLSPMSPSSGGGGVPFPQLELLEATHRGLYRFIPRHHDEVDIEIGDAIYVQKEAEDLWCEGVNLRSGRQGIFPAAHVTDVDYSDFDPSVPKVKKERYLLNYLGSIETLCHKGNQVLCQAVRKIAGGKEIAHAPHPCILEVSDQGIRMVDKSKPTGVRGPCHDYFYHLKHVSFCAFHPGDHRYFGFITKHPRSQRFACHVFRSNENTRPVAEAVGRAFQRFYQKLIETAYPIEEIYMTDDLDKLHLEKLEKLQPPPIPQDETHDKKY